MNFWLILLLVLLVIVVACLIYNSYQPKKGKYENFLGGLDFSYLADTSENDLRKFLDNEQNAIAPVNVVKLFAASMMVEKEMNNGIDVNLALPGYIEKLTKGVTKARKVTGEIWNEMGFSQSELELLAKMFISRIPNDLFSIDDLNKQRAAWNLWVQNRSLTP